MRAIEDAVDDDVEVGKAEKRDDRDTTVTENNPVRPETKRVTAPLSDRSKHYDWMDHHSTFTVTEW